MSILHIITINYTADPSTIDKLRPDHRVFLDEGYRQNLFIASGPNTEQTGGYIIARGELQSIKALMQKDPYALNHAAEYHYASFHAAKYASDFENFIQ